MGHACGYGCSWGPEDGEGSLEGKLQVVVSFLTQVLVKKKNHDIFKSSVCSSPQSHHLPHQGHVTFIFPMPTLPKVF